MESVIGRMPVVRACQWDDVESDGECNQDDLDAESDGEEAAAGDDAEAA